MFKVVCNIEVGSVNINGKKYDKFIRYKDCKPCSLSSYQLTAHSIKVSASVANDAATKSNSHGLNPANPEYKHVYDKVLAEPNISRFKYIAIFEDNKHLRNKATDDATSSFIIQQDHRVSFIYQAIIKDGGEKIWSQVNPLFIDIQSVVRPGIVKPMDNQIKYPGAMVMDTYFLNFLKGSNYVECTPLASSLKHGGTLPNNDIYNSYLKSLKSDVKMDADYAVSQIKYCNVNGENIGMMDASYDPQGIETACEKMGGRLLSNKEVLEVYCPNHLDHMFVGNSAFNVTCTNYMQILYPGHTTKGHDEF